MFKYSINLAWSDEDEGYIATIPELPGLSAFGDTPEEAVSEAKVAAEGFIETMAEDGEVIPKPIKAKTYSGQIRLRLPISLHERLANEAARDNVSLNSYMVYMLTVNSVNYESAIHNYQALNDIFTKISLSHSFDANTLYGGQDYYRRPIQAAAITAGDPLVYILGGNR